MITYIFVKIQDFDRYLSIQVNKYYKFNIMGKFVRSNGIGN